ncbi:isocitrate lyase/PEP mutase family protein [Agromyces marinus]|uniref:Phosphonomutase n=1 Tax=Agromyces marinus TaxID=1389020 RepID=A0ABM8H1H5_9MICO|nr:isocitrate lyase/phosphoenolpyruvate mutase family protein [Agromyces marinus]UIP57312.1 putative protein [Agromyces marinus]BDZ54589.1 phosphonomutase [Agromyces marinus]
MTPAEAGAALRRMHTEDDLLQVVNVWDVASARTIAALPETRAVATASRSIAAVFGYPDGERMPVELMLDLTGLIARAVDVPVSADLESGYGSPGETVRRAIGVGVVGANLEDAMRPLPESAAAVAAAVAAADAEGVPFALNARTDVWLTGGERTRADRSGEAIERGRAYLDAGATCVFVPGDLGEDDIAELVDGIGWRRVSVIGFPAVPPPDRLVELGIARISYGPAPHRVALEALQDLATMLHRGGVLPPAIRTLN